jgi:hypothetical protein
MLIGRAADKDPFFHPAAGPRVSRDRALIRLDPSSLDVIARVPVRGVPARVAIAADGMVLVAIHGP